MAQESAKKNFIRQKVLGSAELFFLDSSREIQLALSKVHQELSYDVLNSQDFIIAARELLSDLDEEIRTVLLVLLAGALDLVEVMDEYRRCILQDSLTDLEEFRNDPDFSDEDLEEIYTEMEEWRNKAYVVLEDKIAPREAHPLEIAFIRETLNQRPIRDSRKTQRDLALMLSLSEGQVGKVIEEASAVVQAVEKVSSEAVLTELPAQEEVVKLSPKRLYKYFDTQDQVFLKAHEPDDFVFPLSRAGRFWIYAVILLSPEECKGERRSEMAKVFGSTIPRIGAVTAYLTGKLRAKASGERLEDILEIEDYLLSKEKKKPIRAEIVSPPDSERGDTFEYDNPVKNQWRRRCLEYIDTHTDPKGRERMRVLCLPGRYGWEIPEYLRLGFKAENIVGVERSQRVEREFRAMADRYGIQAHIGGVEELVGTIKKPFDVANLDFTSPVDARVSKVFNDIRISDSFVGLVNVLGRRDGRFSKEQLALFSARGQLTEGHMEGIPFSSEERLSFMRQFQDTRDSTAYNLSKARREALPFLVSEFFGIQRPESWGFPDLVDRFIRITGGECSPGVVSANLETAFASIADSLASVYSDAYPPGSRSSLGRVSFQLADFLSGGALMIAEGYSQTIDLAHLRYKSPPYNTPFHTILFKKRRPVSIYDSYCDVGSFFVNAALDSFGLRDGQEADLYLTRRRGRRFQNTNGQKVDFSRLSFVYDSPTGVKCQLRLKRCDGFKRAIMPLVKESVNSRFEGEIPVQEL